VAASGSNANIVNGKENSTAEAMNVVHKWIVDRLLSSLFMRCNNSF
jgi:hypothetical protein